MRISFFCSTPNFRGIHQYSLGLSRLIEPFALCRFCQPTTKVSAGRSPLAFFQQLLWELFPNVYSYNSDFEIFATPRLPIKYLLQKRRTAIVGGIVLDFIQYIDDWSPASLWSLYTTNGLLDLAKRMIHTLYFNFSIHKFDFIISISNFTYSSFWQRSPKAYYRFKDRSLVLHPSPSFSPERVASVSQSLPSEEVDPSVFRVHVVTGHLTSKQPRVLEECLQTLQVFAVNKSLSCEINIFGYSSPVLRAMSCSTFRIHCYQGYVDEKLLIKSNLHSHVFLSTSAEEGFGIPLLDSLLFGLKCVCTPIEPFKEICETYSAFDNQSQFSSSSESAANELTFLLLEAAATPLSINVPQRVASYIERYTELEVAKQKSLSDFLARQLNNIAS